VKGKRQLQFISHLEVCPKLILAFQDTVTREINATNLKYFLHMAAKNNKFS
jgi:hypothetical protein